MNSQYKKIIFIVLLIGFLFYIDPVYAGPGGAIAKGLFKTWWGKLILGVLSIVLLPLTIYVYTVRFFAIQKTKKQLNKLGLKNKDFSWLNLEKNVHNIFTRVHIAWNNEDMKEASQYVNHWYWQNQQLVHLDKWKKENLKNVTNLEKIKSIKPLYIEVSENENFEGSKIAFDIDARIEDYLMNRDTKRVVKGGKGYGDDNKIWIMEYSQGKWLLDDIRDGDFSLSFAKMKNVVPSFQPRASF